MAGCTGYTHRQLHAAPLGIKSQTATLTGYTHRPRRAAPNRHCHLCLLLYAAWQTVLSVEPHTGAATPARSEDRVRRMSAPCTLHRAPGNAYHGVPQPSAFYQPRQSAPQPNTQRHLACWQLIALPACACSRTNHRTRARTCTRTRARTGAHTRKRPPRLQAQPAATIGEPCLRCQKPRSLLPVRQWLRDPAHVLTAAHGAGTDGMKLWVPDAAEAPDCRAPTSAPAPPRQTWKLLLSRRIARRARPCRAAPCAAERAELAHCLARVDAARPDALRRGAAAGCRLTAGATPGCQRRRSAGRRPCCTGPTGRPRRAGARTPRPPGRAGTARG